MQGKRRDTDAKNKLLDSGGEGNGGMIWENSTETYILPFVKHMTSLMHEAGHPGQSPGTTWKDRLGREVDGEFSMGGHMYTYDWFMLMSGKNHHNIVK